MHKFVPFIFIIIGFIMVFAAKWIVKKFNLYENIECNFEHEMNSTELCEYKILKAQVNLKMLGLLIALPGIILIFIFFR